MVSGAGDGRKDIEGDVKYTVPLVIPLIKQAPLRRCARQIVVIDDVQLTREAAAPLYGGAQACTEHDYDVMRPVVLASWKHEFQGESADLASIEGSRARGCCFDKS